MRKNKVVVGCLDEVEEDAVAQIGVVYFAMGAELQIAMEDHHLGRLPSKPTVATTLGAQRGVGQTQCLVVFGCVAVQRLAQLVQAGPEVWTAPILEEEVLDPGMG